MAAEMTFWEHLDEMRGGLVRIAIVLVVLSAALFFFKEFLFDGIILAPASPEFFLYRWLGISAGLSLVNIEVAAQFMTHIKVTFICAIILSTPYLLYEIWRFVAPALYEREMKAVKKAFFLASGLFYLGIVTGYCIVLPLMVNFFQSYKVSEAVVNTISLSSYMATFYSTVILFGLVFELPVLIALLSKIGIVTRELLQKGWRYAVLAVVLLAAIITPTGDPFSLLVVSIPLFLLYLLSMALCKKTVVEEAQA